MDARLDTKFESWGGFWEVTDETTVVRGKLSYDPEDGIQLELVDNPVGQSRRDLANIYGRLVDGTNVTLFGCFISNASIQIGIGVGSPTVIVANQVLFHRHVSDYDQLSVVKYCTELSSLAEWMCTSPIGVAPLKQENRFNGWDIGCRFPDSIKVALPTKPFDIEIDQTFNLRQNGNSICISWSASINVLCKNPLPLVTVSEIALQCQNLISLLVGEAVSVKSVTLRAYEPQRPLYPITEQEIAFRAHKFYVERKYEHGKHLDDWYQALNELKSIRDVACNRPIKLLYRQIGRHDNKDLHPFQMLIPYELIRKTFPDIVTKWFERTPQSVLATNVYFFGFSGLQSGATNVKFLNSAQAVESYHRSLGTGIYMDQATYDAMIQTVKVSIPSTFQDDHRQSLKNRLKYGNEYSLRKRLSEMFGRLPKFANCH